MKSNIDHVSNVLLSVARLEQQRTREKYILRWNGVEIECPSHAAAIRVLGDLRPTEPCRQANPESPTTKT